MNIQLHTGLTTEDIQWIVQSAKQQPEIEQLVLFGSRAKGCHRKGSDVDLAIKGEEVAYDSVTRLAEQLNEVIPLPYMFDVLDYGSLAEPALKAHIDRVGIVLYSRESPR
ncbi:Predicted nucleotidyltransferase [Oceanospirillum multiglobuliferum]|uniref:DNA polymerase III subunit beta n=1 Tax=Oceanospirillum multiglobuliferum TaxID=64969 RepID=A0A1T4MWD4_9GAMM|nr:nucleotidyltransferase domain-containing protein [Oceanospirillum multiglobuliferum]OPX56875.1 DNA polymerase III subunit beta [Oceanospirillum multiglobuliferum]SJZ70958.1 Predicted nucleotidyltransferase [Oceanospirillum multiglobuliferum]